MKKKFRDLLHAYRVQSFKLSHGASNGTLEEIKEAIVQCTGEALNNAYTFHFHKDPDPRNAEIFNMIKNFTVEAILPPVVQKIMRRVAVLEKQHEAMVQLMDQVLEVLSEDEVEARDVV